MMNTIPSMTAEDFETLLEVLPDPASHATVFLNGYFDISDLKRQAEQIVPGIDFYNGEGIKLVMEKPSRDILRKLYRHDRETDMEVLKPEDLIPRIQLCEARWYFFKENAMIGEVTISPIAVSARYYYHEPLEVRALREVVSSRHLPFSLNIGGAR